MNLAIETFQLSKRYDDFYAVKDVSLRVNKGEIYGFIGLNGAGKTTTIRMLLDMIKPTQGFCYIKGEKVSATNYHLWQYVGYMVETPHAYPELTVKENLELYRKLRLIKNPDAVTEVMKQLRLTRYAHTKANNLSLGNLQRLGIAKALLHAPEILILDEPVNGLDPAGIVEIRELLQELAFNQGVTILISSHLLSEIAKVASKIGIIHEGQLIQEIKADKFKQILRQRLIIDSRDQKASLSILSTAGYTPKINKNGLIEIFNEQAVLHPDKISHLLVCEGVPPTRLTVEEENLESYFLRIIDEKGANLHV